MDELLDALRAAFEEAGVALPDNPHALSVGDLDALVADKRLRGKCKSALTKFKRAAGIAGGVAAAEEPPAEPVILPQRAEPEPAPEPVAEAPPAAEPLPEPEPEPEPVEAAPMSEALAEKFAAVTAAFEAAGVAVPADPVGSSLEALDDQIPDKKLRASCKSALMKFRRAAAEEGWSAAAPPPHPKAPSSAPTDAASRPADGATAAVVAGVPMPPQTSPADLYLLRDGAWTKLGVATRQASQTDEIVGARVPGGALSRINSILILDGTFEVPPDLYNRLVYLAHEGLIYKAYYISHLGDVKRGTRTASLKVHATFAPDEFAREYSKLGSADQPTAERQRLARFGPRYRPTADMFPVRTGRLV